MEKLNDGSGALSNVYTKIEKWTPDVINEIAG